MKKSTLGESIARFRRQAGITQEELGRGVGVTTQAVSRWECGGTPDVELLPAIADRLHVSVDALFGRDGAAPLDVEQVLSDEISRAPRDSRMQLMLQHIWSLERALIARTMEKLSTIQDMLSSLSPVDRSAAPNPKTFPTQMAVQLDSGLLYYGLVEDLRYALVLPRPEKGYESLLKNPDAYVRLFSLLARPHRLDALLLAHTFGRVQLFTERLAAAQLQLSIEETHEVLEDLSRHHQLIRTVIQDESGEMCVFSVKNPGALIVMLFFCQQIMNTASESWMIFEGDSNSDAGILHARPGEGAISPDWLPETEKEGDHDEL